MRSPFSLFKISLSLAFAFAALAQQPTGCAVLVKPRVTTKIESEYPEAARLRGAEGTVTVRLVVNELGVPTAVTLHRGVAPDLDARAVAAVRQWRFQPATCDGRPVALEAKVEVVFRPYDSQSQQPRPAPPPPPTLQQQADGEPTLKREPDPVQQAQPAPPPGADPEPVERDTPPPAPPPIPLNRIRRIYVDSLGKTEGAEALRQSIMVHLINSDRVTVVDTPAQADAVLGGMGNERRMTYYRHGGAWGWGWPGGGGGSAGNGGATTAVHATVQLRDSTGGVLWAYEVDNSPSFFSQNRAAVAKAADKLTKELLKALQRKPR
jgi:TonB family protein